MRRDTNSGECLVCFRPVIEGLDLYELFTKNDILCGNCRKKLIRLDRVYDVNGLKVHALYLYNDVLEKWMYQIKESKDETLGKCFMFDLSNKINKAYREYVLVPVPSSIEKTEERGFHAVHKMFASIDCVKLDCLIKDDIKQSKLNRYERQQINSSIHLIDNSVKQMSKLLIVDDVCTTGASLKACVDLLQTDHNQIKICVIALHEMWIKNGSMKKVF